MSVILSEPSCSKYDASYSISSFTKQVLLHFKPLEKLLKCHICFEYFNTCMMTKCCHNFCSLCIRKYMTYKAQCPECFQEATDTELRRNRQIDDVVQIYIQVKTYLQSFSENGLSSSYLNCSTYETYPPTTCKKGTVQSAKLPVKKEKSEISEIVVPLDNAIEQNELLAAVPISNDVLTQDCEKVSCPVCSVLVLPEKINVHLDRCLTSTENSVSSDIHERRKPLPKVVYHLLSDKEIRKRLKESGLNTAGKRQALIKRHKQFVLLYNSECDKLNPRPVSEILKQVESEEKELRSTEPKQLFQSNKKSNPVIIEEENQRYLKQNKHQFDALVSEIHRRQWNNQESESDTLEGQCIEDMNNRHDASSSVLDAVCDMSMIGSMVEISSENSVEEMEVSKASEESSNSSGDFDLSRSFSQRRQSGGILKRKNLWKE